MKGFRSTGVMLLVVGALAAYTFYEYKKSADDLDAKQGDRRVFHLLRDQLQEIELTTLGHTTLLRKEGDLWRMVKPLEDLADAPAVEGFIYSLLTQKGKVFRADGDPAPVWSEYGLDPVTRRVDLRGQGRSESLLVSSKNAFDGNFFIRLGEELLLGDRGLAQLIEREPNSFRARTIYRGPETVDRVEVTMDFDGRRETYTLVKEADDGGRNKWTMVPAPEFALDSDKVTVWVQKVQGLVAGDFAAESLSETDKTAFRLSKPSLKVALGGETLILGQNRGEDVFVLTDKRPTVYKVTAANLDSVRVPRLYFRDGTAPFKVPVEQVREIEIRTDRISRAFVKRESEWALKDADASVELDAAKLAELIQRVQALAARDYTSRATGLPATPQITMRGENGKSVLTLAWGGEFKSKLAYNREAVLSLVRVNGTGEIYAVEKDKLDQLIDSTMIKKKESK